MRGLLRKDLYLALRYCRSMLLILAVFVGVSFMARENLFFAMYPCLLCGMIPVTLMSYDERSHWNQYSLTMPYTRGQLVGSKYVFGLMVDLAALAASLAILAARGAVFGENPTAGELFTMGELMLAVSLLSPSLCLPWMFKLGVEKGRMIYYCVLFVVFGGSAAVSTGLSGEAELTLTGGIGHLALLASGLLFAGSWALSAAFFRNKEL